MDKSQAHYEYVRGKHEASLACAQDVTEKIASGEYPLEDAPCFCGSSDETEVAKKERYGIPARIVICNNCALVRINPRMTEAAYNAFYNNDYRKLNAPKLLTADMSDASEEQAALYERQVGRGEAVLAQMLKQAIPAPKVVLDIGCHLGGMLAPFKKRFGSEVWGVEVDETSAAFARSTGVNVVSSVDELIEKGLKADFIIMQDIIEHYLDLKDVSKIRELMTADSFLYVYTPGIFRFNVYANLQLAHTYYFCANTLHWAMVQLGFRSTFIDEESYSFWQREDANIVKGAPPSDWVEYIKDEFEGKEFRKMPPFSGVCKFTKDALYENMRQCFAKQLPDLHDISGTEKGGVAIIAGGPSIDGQVEEIRRLQASGVKIMAILRMYPWCVEHGITPDYVVSLDCTDDQAKGFAKKVPGVTYLFASVTNPSFFDDVAGEKVYIFDSRDDRKIQDFRRAAGYEVCSVVNGGGSVAICCLSLAFNLGFRDLHVFGLDCMLAYGEQSHATGIAGTSVEMRPLEVEINKKLITTTGSFLEFANQALDLISVAQQEGVLDSVKFYGTSLINELWDGKFVPEAA